MSTPEYATTQAQISVRIVGEPAPWYAGNEALVPERPNKRAWKLISTAVNETHIYWTWEKVDDEVQD